jgi:hypothetical protein
VPTKHRKIPPARINQPMPAWGHNGCYREHRAAKRARTGYDEHFGWAFCGRARARPARAVTEGDMRAWEKAARGGHCTPGGAKVEPTMRSLATMSAVAAICRDRQRPVLHGLKYATCARAPRGD